MQSFCKMTFKFSTAVILFTDVCSETCETVSQHVYLDLRLSAYITECLFNDFNICIQLQRSLTRCADKSEDLKFQFSKIMSLETEDKCLYLSLNW